MSKEFTSKYALWSGPDGYRIIHAKDDKYSNAQARYLKTFFKKTDGVELTIVDDSTEPIEKEILVGDTNRYKTSLTEQQFAVNLQDGKLVFEGGHRVMVEKAVKWFMTLDRKDGEVAILSGEAQDFTSKKTFDGEEYAYVWGDEFDGNFLDKTKFTYNSHMGNGGPHGKVFLDNKETLRVENGEMKMFANRGTDPNDEKIQYHLPECLCTGETMWWLYGYAEMRAKVPMQRGCWPAWWATSACQTAKERHAHDRYVVEIDFFEVFGSRTDIVPNIHKWYKTYLGSFEEVFDEKGERITHKDMQGTHYVLPDSDSNKAEYRIYGFRWTPEKMVFSIDGKDYMTYDLNYNFDGKTDMNHFKDKPLHMIYDDWMFLPECWDPRDVIRDGDVLPAEFFVDYVRIYQRPGEGYIEDIGVNREIK